MTFISSQDAGSMMPARVLRMRGRLRSIEACAEGIVVGTAEYDAMRRMLHALDDDVDELQDVLALAHEMYLHEQRLESQLRKAGST